MQGRLQHCVCLRGLIFHLSFQIWLKRGPVLKPGESLASVYFFRLGKPKALEEWASIPVSAGMTARELKMRVVELYTAARETAIAAKPASVIPPEEAGQSAKADVFEPSETPVDESSVLDLTQELDASRSRI